MGNFLADLGSAMPAISQMQHQMAVDRGLEQEAVLRNFKIKQMEDEQKHLEEPIPIEMVQQRFAGSPVAGKAFMDMLQAQPNAVQTVNGKQFVTRKNLNYVGDILKQDNELRANVIQDHYSRALQDAVTARQTLMQAQQAGDQNKIMKAQQDVERTSGNLKGLTETMHMTELAKEQMKQQNALQMLLLRDKMSEDRQQRMFEHQDKMLDRRVSGQESHGKPSFEQQAAIDAFKAKNNRDPKPEEIPDIISKNSGVGLMDNGGGDISNLPPQVQNAAKKLVRAEIPYPGAFAQKDPYWKAVINAASILDPNFNASQHKIREATRKSFTSGKDANNINSINTLVGHLSTLDDAAKKLENSPYQVWNTIANKGLTAVGDPRVVKFNMAAGAVESELASVFKQTGATDQEIKAWRERITSSQSPEQLRSTINQAVELMGSRLQALRNKYEAGMGPFGKLQILSPKSRSTLEKMAGKEVVEALEPEAAEATVNKNPAIETRIRELRKKHSDSEISGFLKQKGIDPSIYGVSE